jgi:hypothetical protein
MSFFPSVSAYLPYEACDLQFCQRAATGHDVSPDPFQRIENRETGGVEGHSLPATFAIRQKQAAALEVHVLPAQMEDFPQAAAGKEEQSKRRRRRGADLGETLRLRHVLRSHPRFVHRPRNAIGLGLGDCAAQPLQLFAGQEALAAVFFELFDPTRRTGAVWARCLR